MRSITSIRTVIAVIGTQALALLLLIISTSVECQGIANHMKKDDTSHRYTMEASVDDESGLTGKAARVVGTSADNESHQRDLQTTCTVTATLEEGTNTLQIGHRQSYYSAVPYTCSLESHEYEWIVQFLPRTTGQYIVTTRESTTDTVLQIHWMQCRTEYIRGCVDDDVFRVNLTSPIVVNMERG